MIFQENLKATIAKKADQTPQKASKQNSSIAKSTSILALPLLATTKQHVSSILEHDLGQDCVPETNLHRIIIMETLSELELTHTSR